MIGNVLKGVQDAVGKALTGPSKPSNPGGPSALDKHAYELKTENWYKALPYGFKWTDAGTDKNFYFLLPINPQNIAIDAYFATNITTSLYGVVEEHSEQRMFDISIEGTTGIAPKYTDMYEDGASTKDIGSRLSYGDTSDGGRAQLGADIAGGLFSRTVATVNTTLNKAQGLVGQLSGNNDMNRTGVFLDKTGYAAFHRLFKFFLQYKDTIVSKPLDAGKEHAPLVFLNYKDNQQYDCSIVSFRIRRNADKPMLYDYSIQLRAYNLQSISDKKVTVTEEDRKTLLGLDRVPSSTVFGQVKSFSEGAKRMVGSVIGGFNPIGG